MESHTGVKCVPPHVVCIDSGSLADSPSYVVLGTNLFYKVSSIPRAVDLAFKSTFVLDLQFVTPARSSWIFLQRAVYGIETEHDILTTRVIGLFCLINMIVA